MTTAASTRWTLGLDTSTDVCVGLASDDGRVGSWRLDDRRAHAEHLQHIIEQGCAEMGIRVADISRVGVGVGPGPFTGLRVGIVTARTLAGLLGDFPTTLAEPVGVCSLDIVARQVVCSGEVPDEGFVVVCDARRKELYWAQYDAAGVRLGEPRVGAADTVPELPIVGPGSDLFPEIIGARVVAGPRSLDAGVLARDLDLFVPAGIEPLYLRKPDATVPTTRKSALVPSRLSVRGR